MPSVFSGFADMPPVFATVYLVGFVDWACREALSSFLTAQQRTVGAHVDLGHSAATPVGIKVTAEAVRHRRYQTTLPLPSRHQTIGWHGAGRLSPSSFTDDGPPHRVHQSAAR